MNTRLPYFITALTVLLASPSAAQQDRLTVYGFFDLELEGTNQDPNNFAYTFDQHHFNVITVYQLTSRWRVFGEIEWEHGVALPGAGELALERGWVEYAHTDGFKVKLGKFVLPYGIYNLLHDASPTFLSTFLPAAIYGKQQNTVGGKQRMYAKFGTGVQALGTFFPGQWQGDYYVYLTNGRGPNSGERDNDKNKGIGGRLVFTAPNEIARFGASFYEDRNGTADGTKQRSVSADVGFGASGFWVETEGLIPRLEEVDAAGVPNGNFRTALAYYVQASYRTAAGVTPFARFDFFDPDTNASDDGNRDVVIGLNVALTAFAFLKGQVQFLSFQDPATDSYEKFIASISIGF